MDEGDFENAVTLFQESISYSPHFKSLELLGECLIHLNRLTESIVPLAAAASLNKGVRALSLLAEVFLKLEDYYSAKKMAEESLNRDSTNYKAQNIKNAVDEILTSTE